VTWILSGLAIVAALLVGWWWWVTRLPTDRRESLSQAWRDQHKREGRH
jgi:HAMP domain-containing protein